MLLRNWLAALLSILLTTAGCTQSDPAIGQFESCLTRAGTTNTGAAAATYMYRLAETPEEQLMQQTMERVRQRRATESELRVAVEAERSRRAKYLDSLDQAIADGRAAVAALSESANAIRDAEIRAAALKIVDHYDEQMRLCAAIARAQRARSSFTESFLDALINKTKLERTDRLARADEDAEKARTSFEATFGADQALIAAFQGTRKRQVRAWRW
ncbi:MAG: hypothetical protein ACTHQM_26230 [Thermoanaerobaculia bacterium]